jgi:hypothetical protein
VKRKTVGVFLVLVMVFLSVTVSFAETTDLPSEEGLFEEEVVEDIIVYLDDAGFDVEDESIDDNGDIVIEAEFNNVVSTITIQEVSNEEIVFDVVEGELENILEVNDEGEVYIDGKEATVELLEEDSTITDEVDSFIANQGSYYRSSATAPYGASAEYTTLKKTTIINVKLNNTIKNIGIGLLTLAIGLLTGGLSIGIQIAIGTAAVIAGNVYDYAKRNDPNSSAISAKLYVYVHRIKGACVVNNAGNLNDKYAYKTITDYYSRSGGTGVKTDTKIAFAYSNYSYW